LSHQGEIVAIKVIDFSKEDELGQQLIQDELNILEDIKRHHPNYLLLLYDHFKVKNHLYIVTEYCEGKDIAKILRKKKVLG
jgi:serine/threonine protein kinase